MTTYKSSQIDITVAQGADYSRTFTFTDSGGAPVPFTSVQSMIRILFSDASEVVEFDTSASVPASGIVSLVLTDVQSALLGANVEDTQVALAKNWGVFDVDVTMPDGDVWRAIYGRVSVLLEATK